MSVTEASVPIRTTEALLARCRCDPEFVRKYILGIKLDHIQSVIFDSVWMNRQDEVGGNGFSRDAWVSANGVGKTYTAAALVLGAVFTFRPLKGIITSKTGRQAEKQTWDEVQSIYYNSPFFKEMAARGDPFGDMQETQLKIAPGWYVLQFSVAGGKSSADIEAAFEGYHQENMILVLDEAKAIHPAIWSSSERLFTDTSGWCRMVAISSAGFKASPFGQCFYGRGATTWKHHKTTAFESPRVSKDRIRDVIETWGKHHPLVRSMIFAEFMDQDENTLIPLMDIEKCIRRNGESPPLTGQGQIAIDWAREGDNKTVFGVRRGNYVYPMRSWRKKKGTWSAMEVLRLAEEYPSFPMISDETGLGGPIQDLVEEIQKEHGKRVRIQGLMVGNPARDSGHFANIRAEMYVQLARRFEKGEISIPDDPELIAELSSIKYEGDSRGRMRMQGKREMLAEGIPSPDKADTLAMMFYFEAYATTATVFDPSEEAEGGLDKEEKPDYAYKHGRDRPRTPGERR